jgi:5-formyltetrahydrofolate cyclo-ligase
MQRQRSCWLRASFLPMSELAANKAALRARMLAARGAMATPGAAEALARVVLGLALPARVAAFWPLGDELDTRPLLQALHARGHAVLLPVTPPRGQALVFRRWAPDAAMETGRFGTQHPAAPAVETPEALLVPLLAFDARGHRLGYGAGYYDRTLAGLPGARAVGLAYAAQQVPEVPVGPDDVALGAVATERGLVIPA